MPAEQLDETFFGRIKTRYARFERPISSLSLFGGFAFDALTLKRIDMFWENLWVIVHLAVAGACIVLANRAAGAQQSDDAALPAQQRPFWTLNILQFTFGGLLSTFLVFYFRSGSIRTSWPFLLLLAAAFVANESFKRHFARLEFQVCFFFLSLFAFAIFAVPVLLHVMGPLIFLLSGAASLLMFWMFLGALRVAAPESFFRGRAMLLRSVGAIFLAINILYFLNLIPPIPLALQDAAVEHSIARNTDGNYVVQSEDAGRFAKYFTLVDTFHCTPGDPVYAYTAVFSPTKLSTSIVHEWQMYDGKRGWVTMSRIALPLTGGRGGGYRTFSVSRAIKQGAWRVNVETPRGALLGRLRFNLVVQSGEPSLNTGIKN